MTKIFIFTHFDLNICHTFLYFVILKGFVFIIGKLVWLYRSNNFHNSKTNMTKNRDKIVNRDTPIRGGTIRPPGPRLCPFAPAPPEACACHCRQWLFYQTCSGVLAVSCSRSLVLYIRKPTLNVALHRCMCNNCLWFIEQAWKTCLKHLKVCKVYIWILQNYF